MIGEIFSKWLLNLDKQFAAQNLKILLFLESHPPDIPSSLKFVKIQFFPPNTTSKLQPMDVGIIKNLKVHYRKNILLKTVAIVGSNSTTF